MTTPRLMLEVGVEGDRFHPHPYSETCARYGCVPAEASPLTLPAATPQPAPHPGEWEVLPLVLQDLQARATMGRQKYGTALMTHNGRDALIDLTQELLDSIMYTRQLQEELACLGDELRCLYAMLVPSQFREKGDCAEAASFLTLILQKNPVLRAR